MKKLGIFLDVNNLFYTTSRKFNNRRKISYEKLLDYFRDLGEIKISFAFGTQRETEASTFIYCLRKMGFIPRFRSVHDLKIHRIWDVGLTVEVMKAVMDQTIDTVVIGSSSLSFLPLIDWLVAKGVSVVVCGSGISRKIQNIVPFVEIPSSMLQKENEDEAPDPKG